MSRAASCSPVSFSLGLDRPSSEFLLVMFPPGLSFPWPGSRNRRHVNVQGSAFRALRTVFSLTSRSCAIFRPDAPASFIRLASCTWSSVRERRRPRVWPRALAAARPLPGAPASHLPLLVRHPGRHADHLVADEGQGTVGLQLQELGPALRLVQGPDLHPPGPQGDAALEGVQPPPSDPVDADHHQGIAPGEAPVQAAPAVAQVGAGGAGDADVPVDVVPPDAGFAEPEFLAEGVHAGDALLQVPAGPDVAEEGHASMLRFIRTGRNRKMTPAQSAEQTGGLAEFLAGTRRAWRMLALVGQRDPR